MTTARIVEWLALLLPLVLAAALWLWVMRRRAVVRALGERPVIRALLGEDLARTPWLRLAAVLLAGVALAGAMRLATPDGSAPEAAAGTGSVILVLDASNSMLAADVPPNRLEAQRAAARALVAGLPGRRFGIVVFAGRAFAVAPPTRDRGAIDLYLQAIDPGMVTQTGSSIAAAIRQGIGLLLAGPEEPEPATLVLVSDGDEVGEPGELEAALDLARRAGVTVHVLGAGTPTGAAVPRPAFAVDGAGEGFMTTAGGVPIVSRLGEARLRSVAEGSGGRYAAVIDAAAVEALTAELRGGAGTTEPPGSDAYRWLALLALALLAGEMVASSAPRRER